MRRLALFSASVFLLITMRAGVAQDQPASKSATPNGRAPRVWLGVTFSRTADDRSADSESTDERSRKAVSADEQAIRESAKAYVAAFSAGNAKSAAAQFAPDAEYIDAQGVIYDGRQAIEDLLAVFFANYPERSLELTIDSLRFVGSNLAIEDGVTTITYSKDAAPESFRYTAVHVKKDGQWLTASVRDRPVGTARRHRAQLKQLAWLLGEWVHEGEDAVVHFSCRSVDNGNFLVRKFTVHVAGQETMTGTQRIGWDPQAGQFRTWVFDSDGGYSEGYWDRDGDKWLLRLNGMTPDGQPASCTNVYSNVNSQTMTFQSVDRKLGNVGLSDSPAITIVQQAPQATSAK